MNYIAILFLLITLVTSSFRNETLRPGTCFRRRHDKKFACTPDFFFIGSSKSGTTSLAYYLQTHPMIVNINQYDVDTKEGHWFDSRSVERLGEANTLRYLERFNGKSIIRDILFKQPGFRSVSTMQKVSNMITDDLDFTNQSEHNRAAFSTIVSNASASKESIQKEDTEFLFNRRPLVMDYTPNYIMNDETPLLIQKTFPQVAHLLKFIVCIRDPTARTLSSWRAKKGKHSIVPNLTDVVDTGISQGKCITNCYDGFFQSENRSMVGDYLIDMLTRHQKVSNKEIKVKIMPDIVDMDSSSNTTLYSQLDNYRSAPICSMKECRKQLDGDGFSGGIQSMAHVVKSMYVYQLIHWLHIYNPQQFLVITLEEFIEKPIATIEKILTFLGLSLYESASHSTTVTKKMEEMTKKKVANMLKGKKGGKRQQLFKELQLLRGKDGWKNEAELSEILKKVKNKTKKKAEIEQQVTENIVKILKEYFELSQSRLHTLLALMETL